jgi:hypothetical protein
MKLLLSVDYDALRQADYVLVDWSNREYMKSVLQRLQAYYATLSDDYKVLSIAFEDVKAPLRVFSAPSSMWGMELSLPAKTHQTAKLAQGVTEHAGVYEAFNDVPEGAQGYQVCDTELVMGEEGIFYRTYYEGGGQDIITAPAPLELVTTVAKRLGLK